MASKARIAVALALVFCLLFTGAGWPAGEGAAARSCVVPVVAGEARDLSAGELEIRLGLPVGSLGGVVILELPGTGQLLLDGARVRLFERLDRPALDRLCYLSAGGGDAYLLMLPLTGGVPVVTVALQQRTATDGSPVATDQEAAVFSDDTVTIPLAVADPEGGAARCRITRKPIGGSAMLLADGSLLYQPYPGFLGTDEIGWAALDENENLSAEAAVRVTVLDGTSLPVFADLRRHPAAFAARQLALHGILGGEPVGGQLYFYPDRAMTQIEFLTALMAVVDPAAGGRAVLQTSLSGDEALPLWCKPQLAAAASRGILEEKPFFPAASITFAEAAAMVAKAGGQPLPADASKKTPLTRADAACLLWPLCEQLG